MAKILLVEDDPFLRESLSEALAADNHVVETASDGEIGLELLSTYEYDVLVLDWQLPKATGIEICQRFRKSGGQTPIIMLTARDTIDDKEEGFNAGADDYQTKPVQVRELRARVRSLLRRPLAYSGHSTVLGPLHIDSLAKSVRRNGTDVQLHPTEFALLEFFLRHPNEILSPDTLLQRVWNSETDASLDAVYTCVKRLRKKLDPANKEAFIRTVYGMGYRLIPPA